MELIPEPNPASRVTILDLLQASFTVCFRLPWVVGTTLLRRFWPWNSYKPPPFREHIFRHVMTCLGNHVPLSLWQWYAASDTSGNNLLTSTRYGHIPHLFQPVRTPEFSGFWVCRGLSQEPVEPHSADLVLLHCHGGGYVAGHPSMGAPEHVFLAEVLQQNGLTTAIFSLDYTLTPKATFPQQRDEVLAAYDWLRGETGVDPSRIVVIGDSAGGHAIMSLLVGLFERRKQDPEADDNPRPAAAVLVSPWLNLYSSHPRALALHWEERLFKRSLDTYCKWILRDATPELKLTYGNFAVGREARGSWAEILPRRTWVTAGAEEYVFLYDMEDVVDQAREDGADIELYVKEGKNHTWQCTQAFMQHNEFLSLKPDEEPKGLMEGYRAIAMQIIKLIQQ